MLENQRCPLLIKEKVIEKISLKSNKKKKISAESAKKAGILMSVLPLAACVSGGDGGEGSLTGLNSAGALSVNGFNDNGANTFTAADESGGTFLAQGQSTNFTVVGGAGADTITTSSGNDMIRGGNGADIINAGAGNDAIVVIGTTTAGQYTESSITNSAGTGTDLSSLISLSELNGRTVSEVQPGEVIDGGSGINTLFIYGTVDLTGVTLSNIEVLVVNSNVTLTEEQLRDFTTIDGDGESILNIVVPDGAESVTLDLTKYNIHDIGTLNIEGDITIVIDDISDIAEIDQITVEDLSQITLSIKADGGGQTNINLGLLAETFEKIDVIDTEENVIIEIDDDADIDDLDLDEIEGYGDVDDKREGEDKYDLEQYDKTKDNEHNASVDSWSDDDDEVDIIKGSTVTVLTDHIDEYIPEGTDLGSLTFHITDLQHGTFKIDGVETSEFTYAHIQEGLVQFIHDGSDTGPTFNVTLLTMDSSNQVITGDTHAVSLDVGDFIEHHEYENKYITEGDADRVFNMADTETSVKVFGKGGNDTITTGSGNDYVDGGAGIDVISTGAGNDQIVLDLDDAIDGGEGFDKLVIHESHLQLDLASVDASGIEKIMMGKETDISLTVQDVLNIANENQDLVIWGGSDDGVTSIGQGWDYQGEQEWEGHLMDVYIAGDATLLVKTEIHQDIS